MNEAAAIRGIERRYMKKSSRDIYIACEYYDFTWSDVELAAFRKMWKEGVPLLKIAVELGRHKNEVAILVIVQAEQGLIRRRKGAWRGTG